MNVGSFKRLVLPVRPHLIACLAHKYCLLPQVFLFSQQGRLAPRASEHWVLVLVDVDSRRITLFDSCPGLYRLEHFLPVWISRFRFV